MKYSISVGTVNLILSFLEQRGIDRAGFCKALQLSEPTLQDPDARIATKQMQTLWRKAIEVTQCEQLPLEMGEAINPYGLGILSYLLMNSPTLQIALEKLCLYQDVACAGIRTFIDTKDGHCQISLKIVDEEVRFHEQELDKSSKTRQNSKYYGGKF